MKRFFIPRLFGVILLFALAFQCLVAAAMMGQTTDETFYSGGGYPIVRYNDYRFLGEAPPLTMQLGALPLLFVQPRFPIGNPLYVTNTDRIDIAKNGALFLYKMGNNPELILFLERVPIILLTVLLALGVYCFAGELFGMWGALLSLGLFAFDPNMIAHGSLYTTDMVLAVFYFFTIYALKRFFDAPSNKQVVWLGLACGATLMSKISSLILLPAISALFIVYYFSIFQKSGIKGPSSLFEKWIFGISIFLIAHAIGQKQVMVLFGPFFVFAFYFCARDFNWIRKFPIRRFLFRGLVIGGTALCAVFAWRLKKKYGISTSVALMIGVSILTSFAGWFARLPASDSRIRLLKYFLAVWVVAGLFIVLGYTDFAYKFHRFIGFGNYSKPLDIVFSHSMGGHHACVEGSFITCDWHYFPGLLAVKTPLLTLVLTVLGMIGLLFAKRSVLVKSLVILPPLFFLGAAMQNRIHIGLRHILPVYPFLFLLAGYAGSLIGRTKPFLIKRILIATLAIFFVLFAIRTVKIGPDHLAYFNELVGSAVQGARLVADSNLNWGQDNKRLAEFVIKKEIPFIKIATEAENADIYDYYKLTWAPLGPGDMINPAPGFYALSIGYYTSQQKDPSSWFYNRRPFYGVGKTFFVFEVPTK